MIRFCFNIGCSESKVIFKWRRTKTTHKGKKAFREANVHTLCISFSLSQNSLSDKQTQSNTVNTQKSPPWACDKRCAEACAERFSALKSAGYKFWTAWAFVFSWTGGGGGGGGVVTDYLYAHRFIWNLENATIDRRGQSEGIISGVLSRRQSVAMGRIRDNKNRKKKHWPGWQPTSTL